MEIPEVDRITRSPKDSLASLSGTRIVPCRPPSSKLRYHVHELLLRLIPMLDLHLFRLVKTAKIRELLDGPEFVGHSDFNEPRA
jgi:hypothetical protein